MECKHETTEYIGLGLNQCTKCGWYEYMGDRFYKQQLDYTGDCPGASETAKKRRKSTKPRVTKADLLKGSTLPGVDKLLVKEIQVVVEKFSSRKQVEIPEGRLRQPFVDALNASLGVELTWKGMTVADMKQLLSVAVS